MKWLQLDCVTSTNDFAMNLLLGGEVQVDTCVLAREQTAGRGRRGHQWVSPRDAGLYLSIVQLHRAGSVPDPDLLTRAAGIGCLCAIQERFALRAGLRGINDIVADDGKIGGVLVETWIDGGICQAVITGVGINVYDADREFAGPVKAISLEQLAAVGSVSMTSLAQSVARHVTIWNDHALKGDTDPILAFLDQTP
ncbi:MAG: biotin--[acetyl-CoA-carboxylase] ligase [Planctomycetota bacterium]|jgi:BirA family biotin operon repressor/biotin-[acetyl-CoA-carboxylase] ligase